MNHKAIVSYLALDSFRTDLESSHPLDPIIYTITRSMQTEKIFLLGIFPANPSALGTAYDLLVLISEKGKRPLHEYESLITNRCCDYACITSSVYQISTVQQLMAMGNFFFSQTCKAENLIYDRGLVSLPSEASLNTRYLQSATEEKFIPMLEKAKSFLSGANNYQEAGDYQLAAFMLHQAAEHCLNAFLNPLIGFCVQTHSLHKLLLYIRRFTNELNMVFPRNTDKEIHLFRLLQDAYIFGRYKNNFLVNKEDIETLSVRISLLQELSEKIFRQKIISMREHV